MKNIYKHLIFIALMIFSLEGLNGQMGSPDTPVSEKFTGEWKFEAPDAPEGSTEGNIVIKSDEIVMTFDDMVAFPSSWVKFRNDSIIYEVQFDLATVVFSLKVVDKDNITGKAVWKEGQTAVFLRKRIVGVLI